jgi:NACalpha-BTF3-like transcription factor
MTKGVTETFSKLSDEIKNFEELRNKGVKSPADFAKLEASGEKIISLYEKLKKSAGDLSKVSGKDLEKLFPQSAVDTIEKARKALAAYEGEVKKAATKVDDLNKKIQA